MAYLIIDCCKAYMAPHEDPDFFFRDVDKSKAEEEEERRQAAMSATMRDDDEGVQVDSDGKVRFSLTQPVPPVKDDGTPVKLTESVNDDNAVPAVVMVGGGKSSEPRLFWVALMPVMDQFIKSAMVYCIAPGMTQYLTSDSNVVSWIVFAANFSNMIGRISTGFVSIWKLWILNLICLALFVYEFVVASWEGSFPVSKWVLIPITVVSSFLSGYVSTQVYMCANRAVIRAYNGDTTHAKAVRSYVSLANQVGMLVGTYGCLLVSSLGVFVTAGKD